MPARLKRVEETGPVLAVALGARRGARSPSARPTERIAGETDARQVFDRLAGSWTYWGWKDGYFTAEDDARAFYDEHRYMLAIQIGAPNSPQWFNTGLHWAYGIDGPAQGHYYVDQSTGELTLSQSAYEHPQPHACFIQSVADDLVNEGGIMDLWVREARLFKYGSGTGSNFSNLRGENERLSGGGKSSGLMSFLKIGDRAAGAIKSGGTTRRAAKMVMLDIDHPDIEALHRLEGERGAEGRRARHRLQDLPAHLKAIMKACVNCEAEGDDRFDPVKNPALKRAIKDARRDLVPDNYIQPRHPVRAAGLQGDRVPDLRHRLGQRGLSAPSPARTPTTRCASRTTSSRRRGRRRLGAHRRASAASTIKTLKARELWDEDRRRGLGLRRPRHPVPHHHQRVAHLPGRRADPRLQPVLGVHVPRRHGLQPGVAQPDAVS